MYVLIKYIFSFVINFLCLLYKRDIVILLNYNATKILLLLYSRFFCLIQWKFGDDDKRWWQKLIWNETFLIFLSFSFLLSCYMSLLLQLTRRRPWIFSLLLQYSALYDTIFSILLLYYFYCIRITTTTTTHLLDY